MGARLSSGRFKESNEDLIVLPVPYRSYVPGVLWHFHVAAMAYRRGIESGHLRGPILVQDSARSYAVWPCLFRRRWVYPVSILSPLWDLMLYLGVRSAAIPLPSADFRVPSRVTVRFWRKAVKMFESGFDLVIYGSERRIAELLGGTQGNCGMAQADVENLPEPENARNG